MKAIGTQSLAARQPRVPAGRRARRRGFLHTASLRTRLCAVFAVALIPAVGLAFLNTGLERERRAKGIHEFTARMTGVVASEHRRVMDGGRGVVVAVANLIGRQTAPCDVVLKQVTDYYKIYANIAITDVAGNVVCSALPTQPNANVSDRKYFTEVLQTGDFTVGEYQPSRITDRPSLNFAFPVKGDGGKTTGVVIAALDLEVLAFASEKILTQLPPGSVFTVLDRSGQVIARKPDDGERFGAPLSDAALLAQALSPKPGTMRETRSEGAVVHAYAPVFSPLNREGWYTLISLPESALLGPLDRTFRNSLLVLVVVLVLAAVTALVVAKHLVLRPANRMIEATRLMARGFLDVRIGPDYVAGELGELARSFDGLAEGLGRRELEVAENQERLADMSRRLLAAQEDERRHIARELHDELGQLLTGAKLNLVSLQGGSAHPDPGFDPLDDTIALVGRALTSVRELSTELRPSVLDDAGLEEALAWLLDRVSRRGGFEGIFEAEPMAPGVPPGVETTLFRIAQEALTNVMRHAGATEVVMTLRERSSALELTVRDNGKGFDPGAARQRADKGKSMGMIGMEERVTLAGGRLELESSPGNGVALRAIVPLPATTGDWKRAAAS